MSSRKSIFKNGVKLGLNQAFSQLCSFAKSVIIARLISPADFGVAATLAMTFSFLEMVSNLAAETVLIQAKAGNEPAFQRTGQSLQALRGLINALFIFALAEMISRLFGVPQAKLAFQCLALLPLIKGLTHLDVNRLQRDLKFGPSILAETGSNLLVTLAAVPLGLWLRDYWAMLWLLILQSAIYVVVSHLAAERGYAWGWSKAHARTIFSFGWPLLINGLLLYVILQGDHFAIGSARRLFRNSSYTLADLGVYSVAFALTFAPTVLVGNVCTSLFLPLLSRAQSDTDQFKKHYLACIQILSLIATIIQSVFIVSGGWFVTVIYGHKYSAAGAFIGALAAMQALRMLRQAPTLAAMAYGDTKNAMICNIVRTSALAGVIFSCITGRSLLWIAASGFVGELLALLTCVWRLQRRHSIPAKLSFQPFAIVGFGMLLGTTAVVVGIPHLGWAAAPLASFGLILAMLVVTLSLFRELRDDLSAILLENGFLFKSKPPALNQNPQIAPLTGDSAEA